MDKFLTRSWVVPNSGRYAGQAGEVRNALRPTPSSSEGVPLQPLPATEYDVYFEKVPGLPARPPTAQRERYKPSHLRLATHEEIAEAKVLFPDDALREARKYRDVQVDLGQRSEEEADAVFRSIEQRLISGERLRQWHIDEAFALPQKERLDDEV